MDSYRIVFFAIIVATIGLVASNLSPAQTATFENEPINYQKVKVNDPVAKLIGELDSGNFELKYDEEHGYLKSLLKKLDIPVSSQGLVFSKTSMQNHRISPRRPRAIYFNDDVYLGFVQNGGVIEIGSTDANNGPVFYSLKQEFAEKPAIVRDSGQCIVCHASSRTQNVPGYLVRSVFVNRAGHPNFGSGTYTTSQSSPFKERWGGWYVTGTHGEMLHMGNKVFKEDQRNDEEHLASGANRKTLDGLVSTKKYLSPHSDIVALMVLEHQTQMHNAITYANFETRRALHQSKTMNEILKRDPDFVSESSKRRIKTAAERVIEHLLMCGEFELKDSVAGTSDFAREFEQRGPRDAENRSLREFDLETRLFKYPCSYLIYSPSFDALPDEVRKLVIAGVKDILMGRDESDKFAHLTPDLRGAIFEILQATKPEFAGGPLD